MSQWIWPLLNIWGVLTLYKYLNVFFWVLWESAECPEVVQHLHLWLLLDVFWSVNIWLGSSWPWTWMSSRGFRSECLTWTPYACPWASRSVLVSEHLTNLESYSISDLTQDPLDVQHGLNILISNLEPCWMSSVVQKFFNIWMSDLDASRMSFDIFKWFNIWTSERTFSHVYVLEREIKHLSILL